MTLNFGITCINVHEDVNKIIKLVAECRVCTGVENFHPDDIIYLPDARKRGYKYYSEPCPVILEPNLLGMVCKPCMTLQRAVVARKNKEKRETETRKMRFVFWVLLTYLLYYILCSCFISELYPKT